MKSLSWYIITQEEDGDSNDQGYWPPIEGGRGHDYDDKREESGAGNDGSFITGDNTEEAVAHSTNGESGNH